MINEMQSVKKNCQGMQVLIREFDIKFVDLIKKKKKNPEENNPIEFLIEANALKRKAEEKSAHLEILK